MSGAALGYNIAEDAVGTWAAYTIMQAKSDGGSVISEADTDDYPGAIWFNFVDDILIQINQVFQGSQQIDAFDILGTLSVDGNVIFTAGTFEVTSGTTTLGGDTDITGAVGITGATGITGDLNVVGSVSASDEIGLTEAASVPGGAPTATHGKIWLKNDTPNTLYFTDDGGTDHQLAAGGGPATHEMFFIASMANYPLGDFLGLKIGPGAATTSGRVVWTCPSDFSSLVSVELVLIPDGTDATLDIDLASDYGADGEAYNTHSGADAGSTYSVTANQIFTLDISGVYANLAAGDYCGLLVTDNDASVNVYILGVRLVYNY